MSSTNSNPGAPQKPDDDYEIVGFDEKLEDENINEQTVREGQLLQDQPQMKYQNIYIEAMSNLMISGKNFGSDSSASTRAVAAALLKPRKLISHDHITTIAPEIAVLLAAEVSRHTTIVKDRAVENLEGLEELLSRVPDGQTELQGIIKGIIFSEEKLKIEAKMMEDFAEKLGTGFIRIKNGQWETIHGNDYDTSK